MVSPSAPPNRLPPTVVQLIVTADIGVKDHKTVKRAKELGLDVLILDHHLPPGEDVPHSAAAVLCPPQQACNYPNPHLAACGVSLKLAQAMLRQHPKFNLLLRSMIKLAAIGTVADVVSLMDPENRAIVAVGLDELNQGRHAAWARGLLSVAKVNPGRIEASDLGFRIGPRINAAGRVSSATAIIELLTCKDAKLSRRRAAEIDMMNTERREIQQRMLLKAKQSLHLVDSPFPIIAEREGRDWHRGVAGIVAARLRDKLHRPVAVVAIDGDDNAVASVRSIPEVHAIQVLNQVADLFSRFGGHPAAAGFSLPAARLPELQERISKATLDCVGGTLPERIWKAELILDINEVDWQLMQALKALEPHGKGNSRPRIILRGGTITNLKRLRGDHLRARYSSPNNSVDVVWWGGGAHVEACREGEIELLGFLEENWFRGTARLQLSVSDARQAH